MALAILIGIFTVFMCVMGVGVFSLVRHFNRTRNKYYTDYKRRKR